MIIAGSLLQFKAYVHFCVLHNYTQMNERKKTILLAKPHWNRSSDSKKYCAHFNFEYFDLTILNFLLSSLRIVFSTWLRLLMNAVFWNILSKSKVSSDVSVYLSVQTMKSFQSTAGHKNTLVNDQDMIGSERWIKSTLKTKYFSRNVSSFQPTKYFHLGRQNTILVSVDPMRTSSQQVLTLLALETPVWMRPWRRSCHVSVPRR